jgi:Holliday junction resolvasome RuvABC endonuclease subunit
MTQHVIGIDPGLDGAGLAWMTRTGDTVVVRDVCTVRTAPAAAMAARLHLLGAMVRQQLSAWQSDAAQGHASQTSVEVTVVLEVPEHVGRSAHARQQGRENVNAKSMAKFWQSLGVIRAAVVAAGLPLVERPPGDARKEYRQALYLRWTHAGRNADERDAIVTACTQLFSGDSVAAIATRSARPS